jgi:MFS family permease
MKMLRYKKTKDAGGSDDNIQTSKVHSSSNSVSIPASAWKVLAILSCIATMVMYAETMLIPAIPDLIKDFSVSYSMSSWILTAYLVSGAVMTPIAGKLSDIYGRKRILLVIMVIYATGVCLAGFSSNIFLMLVARAIQGIGMSMFPIAFGIVRDKFPREKISIGQGVITSMFASGAVIGLAVGGIIIQNYGWRTTFFTIIPVAVVLLLIIRRFILVNDEDDLNYNRLAHKPVDIKTNDHNEIINNNNNENKNNDRSKKIKNGSSKSGKSLSEQIDVKGAVALAIAIASFLLVLTFIETSSNNDSAASMIASNHNIYNDKNKNNSSTAAILPFLILAVASFIMFVVIEKRAKYPLVDFRLMLNKSILPANLIIMLVGLSMFMVFQTIPILVRNPEPAGFGEDAISTGKVQLPFALILLVFGPTSGFIISKLGSLKPIIFGTFVTTAGFIGLLMFHGTELLVSSNLAVLSTGLSLTSVGAMNVIILSTPKQFSGISLGMSSLMRIIGAAIGPALAGMYMQTHQSLLNVNGIFGYFPSATSFNMIFISAVVFSIASIALAILLRRKVIKMAIPNLA